VYDVISGADGVTGGNKPINCMLDIEESLCLLSCRVSWGIGDVVNTSFVEGGEEAGIRTVPHKVGKPAVTADVDAIRYVASAQAIGCTSGCAMATAFVGW
jgi:Zn-dependent alcohol dehydrogenase